MLARGVWVVSAEVHDSLMRAKITAKAVGRGLEIRTFRAVGTTYLVFRTLRGAYHVFSEADAKAVARNAFGQRDGNTREMWNRIWKQAENANGSA